VAFVESREELAFADRATAIGLTYGRIGEVAGFNYSDGKRLSFLLLVPKESQ
jgi:hypothetical protein